MDIMKKLKKMKMPDLKNWLLKRSLSRSGKKAVLVARLYEALTQAPAQARRTSARIKNNTIRKFCKNCHDTVEKCTCKEVEEEAVVKPVGGIKDMMGNDVLAIVTNTPNVIIKPCAIVLTPVKVPAAFIYPKPASPIIIPTLDASTSVEQDANMAVDEDISMELGTEPANNSDQPAIVPGNENGGEDEEVGAGEPVIKLTRKEKQKARKTAFRKMQNAVRKMQDSRDAREAAKEAE